MGVATEQKGVGPPIPAPTTMDLAAMTLPVTPHVGQQQHTTAAVVVASKQSPATTSTVLLEVAGRRPPLVIKQAVLAAVVVVVLGEQARPGSCMQSVNGLNKVEY